MVVRQKKKSKKLRGSKTHGWGFKKRHRGKGHQGGHGLKGGSGKRGQQRKTYWDALHIKVLGRKSMRPNRNKTAIKTINLSELVLNLDKFSIKSGDVYTIDLTKLGYTKLLSRGKVVCKLNIICSMFSKSAKEKIEAAGGKIEIFKARRAK